MSWQAIAISEADVLLPGERSDQRPGAGRLERSSAVAFGWPVNQGASAITSRKPPISGLVLTVPAESQPDHWLWAVCQNLPLRFPSTILTHPLSFINEVVRHETGLKIVLVPQAAQWRAHLSWFLCHARAGVGSLKLSDFVIDREHMERAVHGIYR
jgi:hypothetical protein